MSRPNTHDADEGWISDEEYFEFSDDDTVDDEDYTGAQIERNDPHLTKLRIGVKSYPNPHNPDHVLWCVPPDGDWGKFGDSVGNNTHIKELILDGECEQDIVSRDDMESFFRGAARSASIQSLKIDESELFEGELFTFTAPLFEGNNLESLEIENSYTDEEHRFNALPSLIAQFTSLKRFALNVEWTMMMLAQSFATLPPTVD